MVYVIRQTNCLQVFYETPSMKYVSKFTGKHDRWSDFSIRCRPVILQKYLFIYSLFQFGLMQPSNRLYSLINAK